LIPRLIYEVPVQAGAAALAAGTTEIRVAAELKVKESNRISTVAGLLPGFGAKVEELPDGLLAEGTTLVRDAECIKVSFPEFEDVLKKLLVEQEGGPSLLRLGK